MSQQIPDEVKQERRLRAMAVQRAVMRSHGQSMMGKTIKVLVEGEAASKEWEKAKTASWEHGFIRSEDEGDAAPIEGPFCVARGEADAPDIDGRVFVKGRLPVGQFARVKIIGASEYDLVATPSEV